MGIDKRWFWGLLSVGVLGVGMFYNKARGLRNNNPLNIRENQRTDYDWEGESLLNTDSDFEEFTSPEYGIRAAVKIFNSYRRRGVVTLEQIVSTWAPSIENNTAAYVQSVASSTGFAPDDEMMAAHYPALIAAMIKHENGLQPYSMELIKSGIALA